MQKLVRWSLALAVLLLLIASPAAASAAVATHVVISQLQTATSTSASQEFIELYNPTAADVSLSGWSIEYKAATSTDTSSNWVKHGSLAGVIKGYGFYLIAPKTYLAAADADWSATLAGTAGNLRVKDGNGMVVDQVGYGATANAAEGNAPASAPAAGQSIERLPGRLDMGNGNGVDSDNNAADFILQPIPEPRSTQALIQPPGAADSELLASDASDSALLPVNTLDPMGDDAPAPQTYAPVDITELLVNPMTPLTDAHDEFVELFNPTDSPINLAGYTLRAGSNFHSYYVLPATTLASGSYAAFYAAQTKLAMPNGGGAVEVLDPSGMVVDVTPVYGAAPEGQSWARFDDGWRWTLQTSPGQPNVLATAVLLSTPAATKTPKAAKKVVVKAVKAKAAKKVYVPHPRTKKPKAVTAKAPMELAASHSLQPARWLLIGLGLLTIGYAVYEFRYDIQNLLNRCRGHHRAGAGSGRPDNGGPGD